MSLVHSPETTKTNHVLTADQFDPVMMEDLFDRADIFQDMDTGLEGRRTMAELHLGRRMVTMFYQPSTRTRLSFEMGAAALGIGCPSTENAGEFSSAAKGESIEDSTRVLNVYRPDAIVMRHPEVGSAQRAADVSIVPVINAGDGTNEHPTQALLDMYTIQREHGHLDDLNIVLGGDLKQGRTVRSLARLVAKYSGNHITFVSTPQLRMLDDIKEILEESGTTFDEVIRIDDAMDAFGEADVVYWTRLQKEYMEKSEGIDLGDFVIDAKTLKNLYHQAIIMHPLPRVDEISTDVDLDSRARYFEQAGNGMYIRMALLDYLFEESEKLN